MSLKVRAQPHPQSVTHARTELSRHLEERRGEIEAAVMTRVYSVADPTDLDPAYAEGLKNAVREAVDYGLAAIELGDDRTPPPPPGLLAQARIAARHGVSLDTVLRRYFAGHSLLIDFLVEEAGRSDLLAGLELQGLLRSSAALFDRLLQAVAEEHARECENRIGTREERRAEKVERLLAGELVDASDLAYDFDGHHLALIARGEGAHEAIRELAKRLDRRLLCVRREEEAAWACWLGGRRQVEAEEVLEALGAICPERVLVTLGEPGEGISGWRLSHRQAKAALPVAERGTEPLVRYGEVALLASVIQDELLATSLRELYLEPLERARDGGEVLRETLRAYFAAERNASSAAAALGVSRQTINRHLHTVEQRLGHPLGSCAVEIEAALRLDDLCDRPIPLGDHSDS
jgi:hypothetical protein